MKKFLLGAVALSLIFTVCSEPKTFSSLIEKVPVCELPFGVDEFESLSSIRYDYTRPVMTWSTDIDSDNIYGLNGIFDYHLLGEDLNNDYSLLNGHGELVFSKRFPPVCDTEVVLFYVERFDTNRPDARYPQWVLLTVGRNGELLTAVVIADVDCLDFDMTQYKLFHFDDDNVVTIKRFTSPFYEDADEAEAASSDLVYLRDTEIFDLSRLHLGSASPEYR